MEGVFIVLDGIEEEEEGCTHDKNKTNITDGWTGQLRRIVVHYFY